MNKEQMIKELEEKIAMIEYDIWLTNMSEDSFEPYTQASQRIHRKEEEVKELKKQLEALNNEEI